MLSYSTVLAYFCQHCQTKCKARLLHMLCKSWARCLLNTPSRALHGRMSVPDSRARGVQELAGEELYVSVRDLGQGAFGLVRLAVNRCAPGCASL